MRGHGILWLVLILATGTRADAENSDKTLLPEGRNGLAAKYPGDRGIDKDPNVIFVERFDEKSLDAVFERWGSIQSKEIMVESRRQDRRHL